MLKTLAGLAALVALTATAAAESLDATNGPKASRGYVSAGGSVGVQRDAQTAVHIDGGKRIGTLPLFARGQMTGGKSGDDKGSLFQLRAGIEARGCDAGQWLCLFAGTDAGYQRDHIVHGPQSLEGDLDAHDLIVVPRAGVEAGGKLRFRAVAELPMFQQLNGSDEMTYSERGTGLVVSLAVAAVF